MQRANRRTIATTTAPTAATYACFQAAIAALVQAGVAPRVAWGHGFVQAEFAGQLIGRRKLYAPELRDALSRVYELREKADYGEDYATETQALRALRRTRDFVSAVENAVSQGGEGR